VSELEFNVPFQHKHGYIRDEYGPRKTISANCRVCVEPKKLSKFCSSDSDASNLCTDYNRSITSAGATQELLSPQGGVKKFMESG